MKIEEEREEERRRENRNSVQFKNPQLYKQTIKDIQGNRHAFMSTSGKFIYHIGVIDYLQDFNFSKLLENSYKSLIDHPDMISAVPPKKYCTRFFDFMQSHVIVNQTVSQIKVEEIKFERILERQSLKRRY
uniref:PIPK domain-containing protein n=1 Tax=Strombidium rassoulzadegani TaxID=1082188 RepID=A0A7S3CLM6_9SPIT|mmetsp:Transcript_15910/g.26814  ORF Transcript_15910/g.26814 Transcript_15910/m.26814 type:complete len:131 (+) Transcript_15910:681-1073(+)